MDTSKRTPPAHDIDKYWFNWSNDQHAGLLPSLATKDMSRLISFTTAGVSPAGTTEIIPLGLSVTIGDHTYSSIIVSQYGWAILVGDRTVKNSVLDDVFGGHTTAVYAFNSSVLGTISAGHTLLAPWFDILRPIANDAGSVLLGLTADQKRGYRNGIPQNVKLYTVVDELEGGVWIKRAVQDPELGLCTVVRWVSMFNVIPAYTASSRLEFEIIVCANGRVQYRYAPRKKIVDTTPPIESAAMFIAFPGTHSFRDFASILQDKGDKRLMHDRGAAVYSPSYTDTSTDGFSTQVFSISLHPDKHWPGLTSNGAVFDMSPPSLPRRIFPRLERRRRDAARYVAGGYDDRRSVAFSRGIVSYPTTLPMGYAGSSLASLKNHDLFEGAFVLTGSTSKGAADPWLNVATSKADPFSENRLFVYDGQGSFFASSSAGAVNFTQPLSAKTVINVTLPIHRPLSLLDTTSSVYFYDSTAGSFIMPAPGDLRKSSDDIHRISEDARAFSPTGIQIVSGTNNIAAGGTNQSLDALGRTFDKYEAVNDCLDAVSAASFGSFSFNPRYWALTSQSIDLRLDRPFIVEKAVIELPMGMGDGWFNDRTAIRAPSGLSASNGGFDVGGPAITVALHNNYAIHYPNAFQALLGVGDGQNIFIKEAILSGTIVPVNDVTSSYDIVAYPDLGDGQPRAAISPAGFIAFGGTPSAVVSPTGVAGSYLFSGSVRVLSNAATANGVIGIITGSTKSGYTKVRDLLQNPRVSTEGSDWFNILVGQYSPSGRCKLGTLFQAGRSLFGREHELDFPSGVSNPLYITGSDYDAVNTALNALAYEYSARAVVPMIAHRESPYVIMPGDRLTLTLSKTRPVRNAASDIGAFANRHDVSVLSGTVRVSLYGSYTRAGNEVHDLGIVPGGHGAISEPVLDQYEVEMRYAYSGGIFDAYSTGTLVRATSNFAAGVTSRLVTGTRGEVFSSVLSSDFDDFNVFDTRLFSQTLIKATEIKNNVRVSQHMTQGERVYDSLTPRIDAIHKIGGGHIVQSTEPLAAEFVYDVDSSDATWGAFGPFSDNHWTKSFPFEPKYTGVERFVNPLSQFQCDVDVNLNTLQTPLIIHNAFILRGLNDKYATSGPSTTKTSLLLDYEGPGIPNIATLPIAASLDANIRSFYGFGDVNTMRLGFGGTRRFGTTCAPSHKFSGLVVVPNNARSLDVSPVIRGWKYGLANAFPTYSKAVWRTGRFGQFRDMLEQRQDTKYFHESGVQFVRATTGASPIQVKFVNVSGSVVAPALTTSSNLSLEATSSLPYFDGLARNR